MQVRYKNIKAVLLTVQDSLENPKWFFFGKTPLLEPLFFKSLGSFYSLVLWKTIYSLVLESKMRI